MGAVPRLSDGASGLLGGMVRGGGGRPARASARRTGAADPSYRQHRDTGHMGKTGCGHSAGGPRAVSLRAAGKRLEAGGWTRMSDTGERISLNKGYTEAGLEERVFHLHLRLAGDHDEIFFRDYLRAHPEIAKKYENLKLFLWRTYAYDRDRYTAGKTEFVTRYTKLAKEPRKTAAEGYDAR